MLRALPVVSKVAPSPSPPYVAAMLDISRDMLTGDFRTVRGSPPVEWVVAERRVPYQEAVAAMETRAAAIAEGAAPERVWLVEHPPLYTAGTSAKPADLVDARFPVFTTGRGGQYTYHGPGQRVAYVMLDLSRRKRDVRAFVAALERWIIATLAAFNVVGERREDRVGVWVRRADKPRARDHVLAQDPALAQDGTLAEDKIAAIGIRVRRWVTFHGISLNIEPALGDFAGIVPCGVAASHFGVTSLVDLGIPVTMPEVDAVMRREFEAVFGPTA